MADTKFVFSDKEIQMCKDLFADNETMVLAVRNHMLGLPVTTEQQGALSMLNSEYKKFLRKLFTMPIDPQAGLGQLTDPWASIDTNGGPDDAFPFILSRAEQVDFLSQRLGSLESSGDSDTFDRFASIDRNDKLKTFVNIHTRKQLISVVEAQLNLCIRFAGMKEETVEEAKVRLLKDSSK